MWIWYFSVVQNVWMSSLNIRKEILIHLKLMFPWPRSQSRNCSKKIIWAKEKPPKLFPVRQKCVQSLWKECFVCKFLCMNESKHVFKHYFKRCRWRRVLRNVGFQKCFLKWRKSRLIDFWRIFSFYTP